MKRIPCICLIPFLSTTFLLAQSHPVSSVNPSAKVVPASSASSADPEAQRRILDSYGKLPLSFEANQGQTDGRVKFLSRTSGYSLFLTGDEAVLALSGKKADAPKAIADAGHTPKPGVAAAKAGGVLRMKLRHANAAAKVTGVDELGGTSNYFVGNDPSKWRTSVPTYAKVKYEGIYSGVDLVYYGNQRQLEYDFIVAPGADPHRIGFDVGGAKRIRKDVHGDLVLKVGEAEIRWHRPVVYQEKAGARKFVAAHYFITDRNRVGFELGKYDASRALYIDPLIYSTYLGGTGIDSAIGITVDSAGNAYVVGQTTSTDFPTKSPLQAASGGTWDAFVAKINAAGSALVYSTYLGGSGGDYGAGIAIDSAGNAYVTGETTSTDFPTMNPLQPALAGFQDAFVAKINPSGSALVYSTYLGGSDGTEGVGDQGYGIAADSAGNAYVTGVTGSSDFPTKNPLQPTLEAISNAFVTKINASGSALVYSTYMGGLGGDVGYGITVDSAGNAYVTGITGAYFPTMNPLQPNYGGNGDAFVSKLNPTGSALVYSTYLGGSGSEVGTGIAVDSAGDAYVTGYTGSTDFPTESPLQPANGGSLDAFVAKINGAGSALIYSTYLGGSGDDTGYGIAVDGSGNACVTGSTNSLNFPTVTPLQKSKSKLNDAFVSKLDPTGSALVNSTYLGGNSLDGGSGIAVDSAGNAYVAGATYSTNFSTTPGAFQTVCSGNCVNGDAFVSKIDVRPVPTTTLSSSLDPSTYGQAVMFTAVVTSSFGAVPDGETVTFMKGITALGTGALSAGSASFTTTTLPVGTDSMKAVYGGDPQFGSSTSVAVSQVVSKATTNTTLTSSQNPSTFGQSVTFTATVAPEFGGKITGTVTFYDGTTALKTLYQNGGVAKFTTSTLTKGTHTIQATYNGSTFFDVSSSSPLTQTVQ